MDARPGTGPGTAALLTRATRRPARRASTPATEEKAGHGEPFGGLLAPRAHAQNDDIHLVQGSSCLPQGCIDPGSQGVAGWNYGDGELVS